MLSWHSSRFSRSNDEWLEAQIILGVLPVLTLIEGIECWGLPSTSYAPSLFPSLIKKNVPFENTLQTVSDEGIQDA